MQHPSLLKGLLLSTLCLLSSPTVEATTVINSASNWGTWEGWGVSLAWWAAKFGQRDDLADIFFTTGSTTFNGVSIPGLGFNIVRYNAGACSWNTYLGASMVVSPVMITSRQVEGFWLDWASTSPTSTSWNWTVDANQRAMMGKAKTRGANRFELFTNSPMWWMCTNHNPSGNNAGGTNNLQSWNYNSHAIYLANIALQAKNSWGITFASVEPLNEPIASWWSGTTGTQEGCHFDTSTQATVAMLLRTELTSRGLSGIMVSASDENTYDQAVSTWNAFNSSAKASVGRVNVHGYQYGSGSRDGLYSLVTASGKKIWNSEYGESDATGARLVSNLLLDFIWLHPTAWVYWQALDQSGWGLIDADVQGGTIGAISQKYFVLAQFTRHIKEGMRIMDGGSDYTVAAYDATAQKLVIVAVNWGSAQYLTFDLSEFSQGGVSGALVSRWSTQIGSGDQYVSYSDTYMSGTQFWSYFATNQVMTFEIHNVVL
jgi:galactan endo-1,6-beta-galactosidase